MKNVLNDYNNALQSLLEKGTDAEVSVTTDPQAKGIRYSNITLKVTKESFLTFIPIRKANLLRLTAVDFKNQVVHFIVFEEDLIDIIKSNES